MPRIAYIGSGPISEFHLPAMLKAGLDIVALGSTPNSLRASSIAERYSIPCVSGGWQEVLKAAADCDGIAICIDTSATPGVLKTALQLNKPILVEKPAAWTSGELGLLRRSASAPVMVAYNRRFYETTQRAKQFVEQGPPLTGTLTLPESLGTIRQFFVNSCHGVDLINYVFGGLEVMHRESVRAASGELVAISALLKSARGDVVSFVGNWQSSTNFALALDRPGTRFEQKPFEQAAVYAGMEVIEPDQQSPLRRYVPKLDETINLDTVDADYKPGFVAQADAFRDLIETGKWREGCAAVSDAEHTLALCEALIGPEDMQGVEWTK